jgi:hypothetical protein
MIDLSIAISCFVRATCRSSRDSRSGHPLSHVLPSEEGLETRPQPSLGHRPGDYRIDVTVLQSGPSWRRVRSMAVYLTVASGRRSGDRTAVPQKSRGVPRVDDRRVLDSIFWRLRTGAPWDDLPRRYGPPHALLQSLQPMAQGWHLGLDPRSGIEGSRRRHPDDRFLLDPRPSASATPKKDIGSCCMGRSRGGLTTKIHALVDADGLPIQAQAHGGSSP